MFNQLSIIGCGLIGSSIFKALKKKGSVKKLITFDNDESVTKIIRKEKLTEPKNRPNTAMKSPGEPKSLLILYHHTQNGTTVLDSRFQHSTG